MSGSMEPSSSSGVPSSGVPPSRLSVALTSKASPAGQDDQEVSLTGTLRPYVAAEMATIRASLEEAAQKTRETLSVNLKRLRYMNNVAFLELNRFVLWVAKSRPELKIKFVLSSVIPWAIRKFQVIAELYPSVSIEVYDKAFYPIQQVIEDDDFMTVLRTQQKIVWEHERERLSWHGLRPGLRVADVCCGLGDFAILLQADFRPEYIIGVDHSKPFLRYGWQMVSDFGLENIEYQYGDAAALLLPDNSFDFVSCRLSLQVFHEPDHIVKELYRICRPGGRIYLTNEMMSGVIGYPNEDLIRHGYMQFLKLCRMVGMDLDIGLKTRTILRGVGLEDIKVGLLGITNTNTEPADFTKVVESWLRTAKQMAATAGAEPQLYEDISSGLRAHIDAIMSDSGFALWPIYAGSGRKPFRAT
jgi:ubiquinone/menaquinone biosynthesis C-methylase UbiE